MDHVGIGVRDLDRALAFYREMLGFQVFTERELHKPPVEKLVFMRRGDDVIEILHMPTLVEAGKDSYEYLGLSHVSFRVRGFQQEVDRWQGLGVPIIVPPSPTADGGMRAVFRGPSGEFIELRGL
jgi:lactoylglutathione lyase